MAVKRWVGIPDEANFMRGQKRHVRDSKKPTLNGKMVFADE